MVKLGAWVTAHHAALAAGAAMLASVFVLALIVRGLRHRQATTPDTSRATVGYYCAGLLGISLSADTSWRFFGDRLHIDWLPERIGMFAVIEVGLLACGYGMRANVRHTGPDGKPGSPGTARMIAWLLCGFAAYAALDEAGLAEGLARIILGPIFAMIMLHQALGIEIRNTGARRTGTWQRIAGELRERSLSRLGLADDTRDALTRTRDRAARRAARLAVAASQPGRLQPIRLVRLERAVRAAGVADDPERKARLLAELAVARGASDLATITLDSPWRGTTAPSGTGTEHSSTGLVPDDDRAVLPPETTGSTASVPPGSTAPQYRPSTGTTGRVADLSTARAKRHSASKNGARGEQTEALRKVFDQHLRAGTLDQINGTELARQAGTSDGLGRRYYRDRMAVIESESTAPQYRPSTGTTGTDGTGTVSISLDPDTTGTER